MIVASHSATGGMPSNESGASFPGRSILCTDMNPPAVAGVVAVYCGHRVARGTADMRSIGVAAIFVLIFAVAGCIKLGESSDTPWSGFATHKESGKLEWWFSSHSSYSECIESMEWGVTNTVNQAWYTYPVGCAYGSNSRLMAILMNVFVADTEHLECLVGSKNPELRKKKAKYSAVLKGHREECADSSKLSVIWK
jgi:hypothetical protein